MEYIFYCGIGNQEHFHIPVDRMNQLEYGFDML